MDRKVDAWGLPHGILFLIALGLFIWICAMTYNRGDTESVRSQLSLNLIAEAAGMLMTWFVVDSIVRHRSTQESERLLSSRKILLARTIHSTDAIVEREVSSLSGALAPYHAPMLRAIADQVDTLSRTCEYISLNIQDVGTVDSVAALLGASRSLIDSCRRAAAELSRREAIAATDTQTLLTEIRDWQQLAMATKTQIDEVV